MDRQGQLALVSWSPQPYPVPCQCCPPYLSLGGVGGGELMSEGRGAATLGLMAHP